MKIRRDPRVSGAVFDDQVRLVKQRRLGEPIRYHALTKAFAHSREATKLPKSLKLYCGRRQFATDMMTATGNVFLLKELMGHTDVKTLERYQHPSIALVSEMVNTRNADRANCHNGR